MKLIWDHIITTNHSANHNKPNLVLFLDEERASFRYNVEKQQKNLTTILFRGKVDASVEKLSVGLPRR